MQKNLYHLFNMPDGNGSAEFESKEFHEDPSVVTMKSELEWYKAVGVEGHWAPDMPMGKAQMAIAGNLDLPAEHKDRIMARYRMECLANALAASEQAIKAGAVVPGELSTSLSEGIDTYVNDFAKLESDYAVAGVARDPAIENLVEAVSKKRSEMTPLKQQS